MIERGSGVLDALGKTDVVEGCPERIVRVARPC